MAENQKGPVQKGIHIARTLDEIVVALCSVFFLLKTNDT